MNSNSTGAQFEIRVDGKPRSWRDVQETALEAARYLKDENSHSGVAIRDARNGTTVSVVMGSTKVIDMRSAPEKR
jgi:hypothetical protein